MRRSSLLALATACVAVTAAAPAAKRANRRFRDRPDPGPYLREHRAGRLVRCAQRPVGRAAERHGDRQRLRQRGVRSVPQRRRQPGGAHRHRQQLHPDLRRGQRRRITGQFGFDSLFGGPLTCPDPGTFGLDPITSGNIVVTDAQPFPTSREQCKKAVGATSPLQEPGRLRELRGDRRWEPAGGNVERFRLTRAYPAIPPTRTRAALSGRRHLSTSRRTARRRHRDVGRTPAARARRGRPRTCGSPQAPRGLRAAHRCRRSRRRA